jgi:hypothetical protein
MAAPTPTQVTPTPSSTQIPSMVEVNPITHVPSKIYFSNPPVIFPEPDEDETILIQNAQEMIDQLVSDKILNKALRGIPHSPFVLILFRYSERYPFFLVSYPATGPLFSLRN